jgi:hypothetical protein
MNDGEDSIHPTDLSISIRGQGKSVAGTKYWYQSLHGNAKIRERKEGRQMSTEMLLSTKKWTT